MFRPAERSATLPAALPSASTSLTTTTGATQQKNAGSSNAGPSNGHTGKSAWGKQTPVRTIPQISAQEKGNPFPIAEFENIISNPPRIPISVAEDYSFSLQNYKASITRTIALSPAATDFHIPPPQEGEISVFARRGKDASAEEAKLIDDYSLPPLQWTNLSIGAVATCTSEIKDKILDLALKELIPYCPAGPSGPHGRVTVAVAHANRASRAAGILPAGVQTRQDGRDRAFWLVPPSGIGQFVQQLAEAGVRCAIPEGPQVALEGHFRTLCATDIGYNIRQARARLAATCPVKWNDAPAAASTSQYTIIRMSGTWYGTTPPTSATVLRAYSTTPTEDFMVFGTLEQLNDIATGPKLETNKTAAAGHAMVKVLARADKVRASEPIEIESDKEDNSTGAMREETGTNTPSAQVDATAAPGPPPGPALTPAPTPATAPAPASTPATAPTATKTLAPPAGSADRASELNTLRTREHEDTPIPVFQQERNCAAGAVQCLVWAATARCDNASDYHSVTRDLTREWAKGKPTTLGNLIGVLSNKSLPVMRVALVTKNHAIGFLAGAKPARKCDRPKETGTAFVLWVDGDYKHITCSKGKIQLKQPLPLVDISEVIGRFSGGGDNPAEWALASSDTSSSYTSASSETSSTTSPTIDTKSSATSDSPSDSDPDYTPASRTWTKIESSCRKLFDIQGLEDGGTEEDLTKALCVLEAMQQTVSPQVYSACKGS